ncbi:hypothetical protein P7C73_g1803, partial [Tremellales sp. Uapishka_1]
MAFLVPLLLPHIVETTANIGLGISNAIQGDSSSVSFQIGKKVFTTSKGFNLMSLPYEIRRKILLMALTESKSLILPAPYFFDPSVPMTEAQFQEIQNRNPLRQGSENYRSIVGDRISANGYPISSWRWLKVCSEWRDVLKSRLWENCDMAGYKPYSNFGSLMDAKRPFTGLPLIKSLTLREGFPLATVLYSILSNPSLEQLEAVSILPDYPTPFHQFVQTVPPFNFGFQLIPSKRKLKRLTYGLPLEITTNEASRQHLKELRPEYLNLTFVKPTISLFRELAESVSKTTTTFGIRYVSTRSLVDPNMFFCAPLQDFEKIHLYVHLPPPRSIVIREGEERTIVDDPASPVVVFLAGLVELLQNASAEVQERYTVWNVKGWEMPGSADKAERIRIWPPVVEKALFDAEDEDEADRFGALSLKGEEDEREEEEKRQQEAASSARAANASNAHWERQTDLRLFGGLIGLRLESKKHTR